MTTSSDRDRLWAIVLAGGEGARLASLTTALYGHPLPKQFAALDGDYSMLQATLARVEQLVPRERIVVVVGPAHGELARAQLERFQGAALLIQPASRGTATAILYGAAWIRVRDPAASLVIFPSDHYIAEERGFIAAVATAAAESRALERIVLLGTTPDITDTGYGWIVPGPELRPGVRSIAHFVEKPVRAVAAQLQREGALWNTFILAATIAALDRVAHIHLPMHSASFDAWVQGGSLGDAFAGMHPADFSRDVLQHAADLAVVRMDEVGWSDWGTPERVLASLAGKRRERLAAALGAATAT